MATIFIDGTAYTVAEGQNLLRACLSLGFDVPYFCWHPALHSVGACRQCAVKQFKDEKDAKGTIVMSCMTPVTDGLRISIDDPEAVAFRRRVIEWLMINHPHDCPVCDEGGECHLQDMTVMTGHAYRRHRFKKLTFRNQDLGPFVNHEMNRCIRCYRCVRFYGDHAGGRDLAAFAAHDRVYFGRFEDGALESPFSGNLVEVCPTGVFTDKTFKRHYTRKWDLQTAPSICPHCSLGCNTIAGERYGVLRRVLNRFHGDINGYFLCDRGRFGYEFVNGPRRIRTLAARAGNARALEVVKAACAAGARVVGIGSPRASLEANFALRTLVGAERFSAGVADREHELLQCALGILRDGPAPAASLGDVAAADAVLVLGEDFPGTAPLLTLALRRSLEHEGMAAAAKLRIPEWDDGARRRAAQDLRSPLFLITPAPTELDASAAGVLRAAPDEIARLGHAVAHGIDAHAPAVSGLPQEVAAFAARAADALRTAERPVVVSGTSCGSRHVIEAAANVAWALCRGGKPARIFLALPECNSLGVALLGGKKLSEVMATVTDGAADTAIVLENDLYRRAERARVDAFLARCAHVIALDHTATATTDKAEAVLPAATFAESTGTFVSNEGRGQRFFQVFKPGGEIKESWRWLRDMLLAAGRLAAQEWRDLDGVLEALAAREPALAPLRDAAPPADCRIAGMKIARQAHRASGRTAATADVDVREPRLPDDVDSPLAFSMEGARRNVPPALIARYWAPRWNSVQALAKYQAEIGGARAGGNPGVRLFAPCAGAGRAFFPAAPELRAAGPDAFLFVPSYHVFGSDELSALAEALATRVSPPFVGLAPEDGRRLGIDAGQEVRIAVAGQELVLVVRFLSGLRTGLACLPVGFPGFPFIQLPAQGKVIPRRPAGSEEGASRV